MHFQHTPFLFPLLSAALISAAVGIFAHRHREVPAARSFVAVMACSAGWSLFYALYQSGTELWQKALFARLLQAAAIGMPVAWFVFAARYAELRRAPSRRAALLLSLVPLFTLVLVLTNEWHGAFWSRFALTEREGRVAVDSANGWGFWLHVAYSWLLMSVTVVLLMGKVLRARHRARAQSAAVLFGALVPWVGNVAHISGVVRLPANPMPFLFTLSGVAFAFAIFRFRFLDVLPVAREAVIDEMADGVVVLDPAGRLADLNPAARRILGVDGTSPVGRPGAEVLGRWGLLADVETGAASAEAQVEVGEGPAWRSYDVRTTRLTDRAGAYAGRVVVLRDVTERARMEEQLRRSAFYDGLTGLANRALFHDRLRQAVERGRRGKSFAVLFLDLDRFKIVNDSLGHHVGDELLIAVSRRLESCLRPGDTVARLGGDEFAVLVEEVAGADEAVAVADRIQAVMAQPVLLDGHDVVPSASIGVVMGSELEAGAEHLLRFADVAMYRAKARGRGRAELFDPEMHESVVARMRLETDLRRALERGELRVLYQPIVELATGRTAAMEALLRWEHPDRGLLRPADFMRVAEETGLISAIGEWVLREAAGQLGAWQRELGAPLVMSVNVSTRELADPGFVERVEALLRETAPAHDTLRVEITESAIMRNAEAVIGVLERLEALGVRCYMDDFGTGYSSLSYLHRFPVNVMKVDRTFVERLPAEADAVEIVRTILTLARTLGLEVIAEGVETEAQEALLRSLGCQYAQGFRFSGPLTPQAAGEHLVARARAA
ncbi:MAG TPA: EAL domain-containing protein [Longimicrobium sp.]|nr:EAL domain-containing protein [Longimicrobium sp.]